MTETIKDYLLLAKPGIILGNLVSAAAGFFLAARGDVHPALLVPTLLGVSLTVASGSVLNNIVDRNTDRKMTRTQNRALPRGAISPGAAFFYGLLLGAAGIALLGSSTNIVTVVIVAAGLAIYVGLYSLWLKPLSVHSSLIGSLAGSAPALAGYCAVSKSFDTGALILLFIFSLWQMPHCYAIAVFRYGDYAAAGIPVLPVKQGIPSTIKHVLAYMLAFMAATLMLTLFGYTGYTYVAVATVMNGIWLRVAWSGFRTARERVWARKLFVSSILILAVLCVMMSIDYAPQHAMDRLFLVFTP